jgi:hypothetical protein
MEEYRFGNWLVNHEGISWIGKPYNKDFYFISKQRLNETRNVDNIDLYNWLIHTASKTWITESDVYTLNTAFVFAIDFFNLDFKTGSFVETLKHQQYELQEKKQ